ncbi:MAG: hypothetical protein IJ719_16895 [Clostridia bacterium]|nr:hypothetical protein [Clostridia bacterium]
MIEARHIVCPLCEKGYAAFLQDLSYTVEGHSGYWEKLQCPKCEAELLVSDTANYYLLPEKVKAKQTRIIFR